MIGTALSQELVNRNHEIIILTRDRSGKKPGKNTSYAEWDVRKQAIDREAIERSDIIVHLAGANVSEGRWTDKRKQEIRDSRVKTGELIVKALREIPNKIRAVVSASAIGYYGPDPQVPNTQPFVETDPGASDFLGTVVQQWENAIGQAKELGKRVVFLRTGIVLSREGGAFPEFKKPLRFGLATILGSGKQVVSWIAISDLIKIYTEAIENENWNGAFNAVAPTPVSNKDLVLQVARKQKLFIPIHVPEIALKAILGEMSIEVLKSATVSSEKIRQQGYEFLYPTLDKAIQKLEAS